MFNQIWFVNCLTSHFIQFNFICFYQNYSLNHIQLIDKYIPCYNPVASFEETVYEFSMPN